MTLHIWSILSVVLMWHAYWVPNTARNSNITHLLAYLKKNITVWRGKGQKVMSNMQYIKDSTKTQHASMVKDINMDHQQTWRCIYIKCTVLAPYCHDKNLPAQATNVIVSSTFLEVHASTDLRQLIQLEECNDNKIHYLTVKHIRIWFFNDFNDFDNYHTP